MKSWENALLPPTANLHEALICLSDTGLQVALIVDDSRRLLGIVTDGDIRRALVDAGGDLTVPLSSAMNPHPKTLESGQYDRQQAIRLMRKLGAHHLPVIDSQGIVVALEVLDRLLDTPRLENQVVLMAGGLGTRLGELTRDCPKPMLKIGGQPILETILKGLIEQGFYRFTLAVNYRAEMIVDYFGDGSALGAEIRYLHETKRMGTAGALSLMPERPDNDFLVMNADLLTKMDFTDMLSHHRQGGQIATMAVREYETQIPFGVVESQNGRIKRLVEKPRYSHHVNAGVYVLSPAALDLVPADTFFDMPTLFNNAMEEGQPVAAFPISEYWLDIGRRSQLEEAKRVYETEWDEH